MLHRPVELADSFASNSVSSYFNEDERLDAKTALCGSMPNVRRCRWRAPRIQQRVQRLFHRTAYDFSQVLLNLPPSIWITWLNFGTSPWLVASIAAPFGPSSGPLPRIATRSSASCGAVLG